MLKWSSGMIIAFQAIEPGSIPGLSTIFFLGYFLVIFDYFWLLFFDLFLFFFLIANKKNLLKIKIILIN
jgi:hypothetical protein